MAFIHNRSFEIIPPRGQTSLVLRVFSVFRTRQRIAVGHFCPPYLISSFVECTSKYLEVHKQTLFFVYWYDSQMARPSSHNQINAQGESYCASRPLNFSAVNLVPAKFALRVLMERICSNSMLSSFPPLSFIVTVK